MILFRMCLALLPSLPIMRIVRLGRYGSPFRQPTFSPHLLIEWRRDVNRASFWLLSSVLDRSGDEQRKLSAFLKNQQFSKQIKDMLEKPNDEILSKQKSVLMKKALVSLVPTQLGRKYIVHVNVLRLLKSIPARSLEAR